MTYPDADLVVVVAAVVDVGILLLYDHCIVCDYYGYYYYYGNRHLDNCLVVVVVGYSFERTVVVAEAGSSP